MTINQLPDKPATPRNTRRSTLIFLAGLVAAPFLFTKVREILEPCAKNLPVMRIHKQPLALGDVTFENSRGVKLQLTSFRGKFLLINVWATWCPPCRKEMPSLERMQAFFAKLDRLNVVALSVDKVEFPQLQGFYNAIGVKSLDLYKGSESEILNTLGIGGLPTTLLLNPDGEEVARLVGPTEWDNAAVISQLMGLTKSNTFGVMN